MSNRGNVKSESLFDAILALGTQGEARAFFRDLLTEGEISEFSNRWQAARMLSDKVPYSQIERETGLSSATIARIAKWLNGGTGGYRVAIARLNNSHHRLTHRSELGKD